MSKRGWLIVSVAAGAVAGAAGLAAGAVAYIHHARNAAVSARGSFDPYYAMVEYLLSPDEDEPTRMEPEA